MKFKTGDYFEVPSNGQRGLIRGISFNSIHSYAEYIVEWDSRPGFESSYLVEDGDALWEFITGPAPFYPHNAHFKEKTRDLPCTHEWVDVGFQFSRLVCKKCNLGGSDGKN